MECGEPLKRAGEIGLLDSGGEMLVISKEDEIGPEGANRSEEILVASQERVSEGKSPLDVFEAYAFCFLRHHPFYALDSGVASHKDEEFASL